MIVRSQPALLWKAFELGAPWLPVTIAIEGIRLAIEATGTRALYQTHIRFSLLFRATVVTYAVAMLAPGGRATGEAVRAGMLRRCSRLADTAAAATSIQTSSLLALCGWSVLCSAVALGVSLPLAGALALQAVVTGIGAAFVSGVARTDAAARLLGRVWPKAGRALDKLRRRARGQRLAAPLVALFVSRGLEMVQYGVLLLAVTRRFSPRTALLAFGIATVAGSIGDSVPVQVGVLGAGLAAGAPLLGITREHGLAMALLAHGHQIVWSVAGLLTPLVWRVSPSR